MADQNERVAIIVEAEDRATRTLTNVAKEMGDVAKESKGLSGAFSGLGSAWSTALGVFTGGLALDAVTAGVSALTGVVTDGIASAREAALGYAQLDAALASTGATVGLTRDQLADMSSDLSLAAGASKFSDDAILAAENLLLTFTNVRGEVFKEATAMTADMATALGTEPQQQAIALGKALNDPIKGVTALTRVGVTFTDQQKEQIKVMVKAGDVAGAQQVILDELNKEFGGSAKAAADALGPQAQFAEIMGELGEEIGTAVLPMLNEFFDLLMSPQVQGAIHAIVAGFTALLRLNFDSIKTFFQALTGNWTDAPDTILPIHRLFGNLGLLIRDTVVPAFERFVGWVHSLGAAFQDGGLSAVVPKLLDGLLAMRTVIVENLATWAAAFIEWIVPMIPPFIEELRKIQAAILDWILENTPEIAAQLLAWYNAFLEWIAPLIPPFLEELGKLLASGLVWIAEQDIKIAKALIAWAKAFAQWVMDEGWPLLNEELATLMGQILQWIIDEGPRIAAQAVAWGGHMITGILDGLTGGWWRVAAKIAELMQQSVTGGLFNQLFGAGGGGGSAVPVAAGLNMLGAPSTLGTTAAAAPMYLGRPNRPGGTVTVAIAVDARGAADPYAIEQASYRGVQAALSEASRRSVGNFRLALDQLGRSS